MSFQEVLQRGDEFLKEFPRQSLWWNIASHATCLSVLLPTKLVLNVLYRPYVHNIDKLDYALDKARRENRSLLTVMNHMSIVDDPTFYAALPMRFLSDLDTMRWGFGAENICFANSFTAWFFSLGKVLSAKRFGAGPFQTSLDAAIRVLSPDDTLSSDYFFGRDRDDEIRGTKKSQDKNEKGQKTKDVSTTIGEPPIRRSKTSWFHVFPEGYVLQLHAPHNNSMRYFKWGVSRLILESTRAPVVVPIYAYGFEKLAPENRVDDGFFSWFPSNIGSEVHINIGDPFPDEKVYQYREQWMKLCEAKKDPNNHSDLSNELKYGPEVKLLRSNLAAELRSSVLAIKDSLHIFYREDARFQYPEFWKAYTVTEGKNASDVKFVGRNWADKRLQKPTK